MKTQDGNVKHQFTNNNKDHYIKFKLEIGCFSWCKCFYVLSNFEDWENVIHFGIFFLFNWEKNILFGFGNDSREGSRFNIGTNH